MKIKNLAFVCFFGGISLLGVLFSTLTLYSKSVVDEQFMPYFILTSVFSGIIVLYAIVLNYSVLKSNNFLQLKITLTYIYIISILYFFTILLRQYFSGNILEIIVISCLFFVAFSFIVCGAILFNYVKKNKVL